MYHLIPKREFIILSIPKLEGKNYCNKVFWESNKEFIHKNRRDGLGEHMLKHYKLLPTDSGEYSLFSKLKRKIMFIHFFTVLEFKITIQSSVGYYHLAQLFITNKLYHLAQQFITNKQII